MAESKKISRSKLREVLQAADSREQQKRLLNKLRTRGYDVDNPIDDEPKSEVSGLGRLGRLGTQFERGFRQVPGLPDASGLEKGAHLAGEIGLPIMGSTYGGLIGGAAGLPLGPAGVAAGAAQGSALGAGMGRAVQKGASRAIEAVSGQDIKDEPVLNILGDVAGAAAFERLGSLGAEKISKGYGIAKEALKEGTSKILGGTTKAGAKSVETVINNFDDAVRLGKKVVKADGSVEHVYSEGYRKAITPEGMDEPLKDVWSSTAERLNKSAGNIKPDELATRADEVLNNFGTYKNKMFDLIGKRLQLESMLQSGKKVNQKELDILSKEIKSLRETQTTGFTLQDALDGIQALNARASSGKLPRAAANRVKEEVESLVTWAEHNGLPDIRKAMKGYNLGVSGRKMSTWLPEVEPGMQEAAFRLGAITAGAGIGGWTGGQTGAVIGGTTAAALQSPVLMREAIRMGLVGGKVAETAGRGAAKAAPALGQLSNALMRRQREER